MTRSFYAAISRRLARDRRGGVAVMAALFGGLICVCAALAVDAGVIFLKGREVQSAADLSALAAAGQLAKAGDAGEATARANLQDLRRFGWKWASTRLIRAFVRLNALRSEARTRTPPGWRFQRPRRCSSDA